MEINASAVKENRLARGWTQQHLADACAISLRTVQRIEKHGSASNETLMGLCAVFEVPQDDLVIVPRVTAENLTPVSGYSLPAFLGIAIALGAIVGALFMYLVMSYLA